MAKSKLSYWIIAAALAAILAGCTTTPDPWEAAIATEKANRATIELETNRARIDEAGQARADQTNLQALQAHQAAVQAAGQIAQANAISAVVASNNQTVLAVAQVVGAASKTDYTPVYVGMTLVTVIIIAYLLIAARRPAHAAQAPTWRMLPNPPAGTSAQLCGDGTIYLTNLQTGATRLVRQHESIYALLTKDER
jgi:hypothetical protein